MLEREVRANVVDRSFCRIGTEKLPDAKTLVRLGQAIGAETIGQLRDRIVAPAQERKLMQGGKMRVETHRKACRAEPQLSCPARWTRSSGAAVPPPSGRERPLT